MDNLDAIFTRRSVRTFVPGILPDEKRGRVRAILDSAPAGPGGGRPRAVLLEPKVLSEDGKPLRIGTYGVIKNPAAFIALVAREDSDAALIDLGYFGQAVSLELERIGLGSCWLGGTFGRSAAAQAVALAAGETLPALMAIGVPAGKATLLEGAMRRVVHSDSRKALAALLLDPARPPAGGSAARICEAIRRAPSASNKQPWRLAFSGADESFSLDLRLERNLPYERAAGYRIQSIDAGIAAAHAELAAFDLDLPFVRRATPGVDSVHSDGRGAEFIVGWRFGK